MAVPTITGNGSINAWTFKEIAPIPEGFRPVRNVFRQAHAQSTRLSAPLYVNFTVDGSTQLSNQSSSAISYGVIMADVYTWIVDRTYGQT